MIVYALCDPESGPESYKLLEYLGFGRQYCMCNIGS